MLFIAALAGHVAEGLVLLGVATVLLYGAFAIHNAKVDGDYELPEYYPLVMGFLLAATFALSLVHRVVGFTVGAWMVLGIVYNTIARRIYMGDVTLLAITHHALPAFSAGLLSGLTMQWSLTIAAFLFTTCWFFIHVKNLKDIEKDSENGYDTMVTRDPRKGIQTTQWSLLVSFLLMALAPFVFDLGSAYSGIILVLACMVSVILLRIEVGCHEDALDLIRMLIVVFLLGVSVSVTSIPTIIIPLASLAALYSSSLWTSVHPEGPAFYMERHLAV